MEPRVFNAGASNSMGRVEAESPRSRDTFSVLNSVNAFVDRVEELWQSQGIRQNKVLVSAAKLFECSGL